MKAKKLMTFAATLWLCCMGVSAQVAYPSDMFSEEMVYQVKPKGAQPTIADFINAYFDTDDGYPEIWGTCLNAWNNYKEGKPQEKGSKVLLDTKNGFMRFTLNLEEAYGEDFSNDDGYDIEMCYWNCADKMHKVFAISLYGKENGQWTEGQYGGISFHIYDNETHKMYQVPTEEMGIALDYKSIGDKYPVHVFKLPNKGKDIIWETYLGSEKTVKKLKWDGMRFK